MNNGIFRPFFSSRGFCTSFISPHQPFPQNHDFVPPSTLFSNALQHYINSETPSHGQKIHSRILKSGFVSNANISIKLLILYLKCNCLRYARQVFDDLRDRTLSAYNYMINGYHKQGQVEESLGLVHRLLVSGENPDGFTFSMILKASTSGCNAALLGDLGRMVHTQILKSDVERDEVLYTALIDSYVKNGRVVYARTVFDVMLEKNVVCSTSLISGYMNQGSFEDAECIFLKTLDKDVVEFNAMIEGYSKTSEYATRSLDLYIDMQSALVDMYSKCGRVVDARRVFDHMLVKNVFSWTSMIDGYGKNGFPDEALELFVKMQTEYGIVPNYVTLLSALSACAHAGLVDKGWEIIQSMENEYLVKPGMEHYACMVDLLGRAGMLNQAWEFIMRIPEKPISDVWAALLSSCRLHGNIELAKLAANELFKLNATGRPGAYVALSNTLVAAGKWESVTELREIMKERGISKDTGRSWVGADDGKQSTRIRSSSGSNGYFSEQRCEASHCGRAKTKGSKGTKGLSGVCRSLWISNSSFVRPIFNDYSSVGYSLLIKKEKAIKVQPNRATIGNGPSFGWVFMADFLTALAKKVKTNTATVENYRCIYVPPGIPLRREKDEPLRVNVIFKQVLFISSFKILDQEVLGRDWNWNSLPVVTLFYN
ncbi:hypothetical protein JHK87_041667 [Glycine soja]|nr:hypothetical protein JHK87_041667 [Glycine soja]